MVLAGEGGMEWRSLLVLRVGYRGRRRGRTRRVRVLALALALAFRVVLQV